MTDSLQAQRDYALVQLANLKRRGAGLDGSPAMRLWQEDCAAAIHQLAGGSKQHWLSRAFSEALLVRSDDGGALVEADPGDIVRRIIAVLDQAIGSLSEMDAVTAASTAAAPAARRFDFVHDVELRPLLERAFAESGAALEQKDFTGSLAVSCGIIEALLTDAIADCRLPIADLIAELSFAERIAAAEQAGLIRGGCRRLPAVALAYRDVPEFSTMTVTARDATVARQVLHVVMRDLDPGR